MVAAGRQCRFPPHRRCASPLCLPERVEHLDTANWSGTLAALVGIIIGTSILLVPNVGAAESPPSTDSSCNLAELPQGHERFGQGILCDDISEFESHMPSHAVQSPPANI